MDNIIIRLDSSGRSTMELYSDSLFDFDKTGITMTNLKKIIALAKDSDKLYGTNTIEQMMNISNMQIDKYTKIIDDMPEYLASIRDKANAVMEDCGSELLKISYFIYIDKWYNSEKNKSKHHANKIERNIKKIKQIQEFINA